MSTSKFWTFTLNNPLEDEEQHVTDFLGSTVVQYGVFGREVGDSGTPHLQGFVILRRSQRLSYLRARLSIRAHFEIAVAPQQAADYCKKDGDFEEFGTFPASMQGRRRDLERVLEWVDQFTVDNNRPPESPDFARHQPEAYIRYPRLVRTAALRAPARRLEFGEPNEWQRDLRDRLIGDADDRTIDFVVDEAGERGKTWFCRWMLSEYPENVQVLGPGRFDRLAHALDTTKKIFLFNIGRGQLQFLPQGLLENLKDRMVMSTMWGGGIKRWYTNVHVVVLCNEYPEETLTASRYNYIGI